MSIYKWLATGLILLIVLVIGGVLIEKFYLSDSNVKVYPKYDQLKHLWSINKSHYVTKAGYIYDKRKQRVTSEGQSYGLLQAAWMNDPGTFAKIFQWTENHLRRKDGLYAWLWDPKEQKVKDHNTATDADQDIAFALIIAGCHFQQKQYLRRARHLIQAIRQHESANIKHGWFPVAGNWALNPIIINISYFAPYEYDYFQVLDPQGNWQLAKKTGYDLLARIFSKHQWKLPPDFVLVSEQGDLTLPQKSKLSADFSYDAMRVYWRTAVDCLIHHSMRGCSEPAHVGYIRHLLANTGQLVSRYDLQGHRLNEETSMSFYGNLLLSFQLYYPHQAKALLHYPLRWDRVQIMLDKLDRYYDINWVWFGLAAYQGLIKENTPSLDDLRHHINRMKD